MSRSGKSNANNESSNIRESKMTKQIGNGFETFKDEEGNIYQKPQDVRVGQRAAIIGCRQSVECVGEITRIEVFQGSVWVHVDVGGRDPIPRKLNEIAVPLF